MNFESETTERVSTRGTTKTNLDIITANSNTDRLFDGQCEGAKFMLVGPSNAEGLFPHVKVLCNRYGCPVCGPKKRAKFFFAFRKAIEEHGLSVFVTLTLDPSKCSAGDSARYIKDVWNKHRTLQKRHLKNAPSFICVLEFQKSGYAHLHLMVSSYVDPNWLCDSWQRVGGGRIVDVRSGDDSVGSYVSKYLSKGFDEKRYGRFRRVSTSRDIRLFIKKASEFEFHPLDYFWAKEILGEKVKGDIISGKLITGFLSEQAMVAHKYVT